MANDTYDELIPLVEEARAAANAARTSASDAANSAASADNDSDIAYSKAAEAAASAAIALARSLDATAQAEIATAKAALASEKAVTVIAGIGNVSGYVESAAHASEVANAKAVLCTEKEAAIQGQAEIAINAANAAREDAIKVAAATDGWRNPSAWFSYDLNNGWYTNDSVKRFMQTVRNGLEYGVSIPKGEATACTKLGANAPLAAPIPGIIGTPAVDPYEGVGPFLHWDCNAVADEDGVTHITGIEGDQFFARDGSNGNVFSLVAVLYEKLNDVTDAVQFWLSDTQHSGYMPQPGALQIGGVVYRPYMLYAKYGGATVGGKYVSISGVLVETRDISHNTLITKCDTAHTGYSGKSYVDDWYMKAMFVTKYGTKNFQSVFGGCTSYNYGYAITSAESGTKRAIIATSNATNLVVGSTVCVGSGSDGRTSPVVTGRVLAVTPISGTSNSAVDIECSAPFTTTTSLKLATMPWYTGATDGVVGDGSPFNNLSAKEPCKIQGIETMYGCSEILSDVVFYSNGTDSWEICYLEDTRNASTSAPTNQYTHSGMYIPSNAAESWKYTLYPDFSIPVVFGTSEGGSTSSGVCDGIYASKKSVTGSHEACGLGGLSVGANAGLWCVYAIYALGDAVWSIGSRLSVNGRKGGVN